MSYTLDIHQTVKTCVKIYNSNFPNFPNADAHLNSYTGYCKYKYWTCVLLGRCDEALVMFQKGLDIFRLNYGEFPKQFSMAKLHESIGDIFHKKNKMVLAKEHYEIALENFRRAGKSESDRLVVKLMGNKMRVKQADA